jgi:hypothetical protein
MLGWLRRRARARPTIDPELWARCVDELRLLDGLDADARRRLLERVERFLRRRAFSGAHGLRVDERMRVLVAALACLPVLNLPFDWLGHWHEVILYPGQFRVRRHEHDDDGEVVTEWDDELAGESWTHGPLVLSWNDIEQDLREPFSGFNVVIHEIAHKLDMADGASDGVPPIADAAARRRWIEVMQRRYDALAARLERGEESAIDDYAAEAPDEFFAVVSEYYFSAPDVLLEHEPEVHAELARFYAGETGGGRR